MLRVIQRIIVGVVGQSRRGEVCPRMHHHHAFEKFDRGRVSGFVIDQVMNFDFRLDAHTFGILDGLGGRSGVVERILNPFLRANRRACVNFRILCIAEPHLFDD